MNDVTRIPLKFFMNVSFLGEPKEWKSEKIIGEKNVIRGYS